MERSLPIDQHYLTQFESIQTATSAQTRSRRTAMDRLSHIGFPTRRHEDWKYTDVRKVATTPFVQAPPGPPPRALAATTALGTRLVFLGGHLDRQRSDVEALPDGLTVRHGGRLEPGADRPFLLMNAAFSPGSVHVVVAPGATIEHPIELVFASAAWPSPTMSHPTVVLELGEGAEAVLIERYIGDEPATYLTNAALGIHLAAGARLHHVKLQTEGADAWHVQDIGVDQARDSRFVSHSIALGAHVARTEIAVRLLDTGAEAELSGLVLARNDQVLDHHVRVHHQKPHARSEQLFKGIVDDSAKSVFTGRVVVHRDAQKTRANQSNNNLLLSESAVAHTRPQLEIYADDVKCSHGATVGQLDPEQVFYLRSRGIGHEDARAILGRAFANEVVASITDSGARDAANAAVREWFQSTQGGGFDGGQRTTI